MIDFVSRLSSALAGRYALAVLALCVTGGDSLAHQPAQQRDPVAESSYDVVVYGGTAAGVVAAVQTKRMGKSVVLIESGTHLGGLTSGGLGATDIGNKAAIGGIAREFYRRVAQHYDRPDAWTFQTRESYRSDRQRAEEAEMWTFEPHVAEQILREMIREARVPVFFGERLDLRNGVVTRAGRIESIRMERGRRFLGRMFIDATYEGDLMAKAGVSYVVGREGNARYGETLNGVQTKHATHHQFTRPVDPFVKPGDPTSGLLAGLDPQGPGEEGAADHRVQAYNLRICATDAPGNRRPWPKPADHDPRKYELLLRNFEAGDHRLPWNRVAMPNRKTDSNNNFAVSTDYIGQNYAYPDGDYATRERIVAEHRSYTAGLTWTLANSPRVPEQVRRHFQEWGLAQDEFVDNDNWPHQLYVREARRMVSEYVMTQHNCQRRAVAEDSVGLAAYTMDSHNTQRYVRDGRVLNEGDVQVGGFPPYSISYRSIVPRERECLNLLVPVALSATHIAYGSIRMEPVFMVLGQSAGTAGSHAIDEQTPVQRVDYGRLRNRLLADKQILAWTATTAVITTGLLAAELPGIVLDDTQAELTGDWQHSSAIPGYVATGYLHDGNDGKGDRRARFRFSIKTAGRYEVRLSYTPNPNRATNVPVTIRHADGVTRSTVNQRLVPDGPNGFVRLGTFRFAAGADSYVEVSNAATDGHVIVDAVQLVPRTFLFGGQVDEDDIRVLPRAVEHDVLPVARDVECP